MAPVRQLHAYLTAFVAPTILFFAVTGALQLFGLHEAHAGYRPPPLIEKFGRLHTDQVFERKPERAAPPAPTPDGAPEATTKGDGVSPVGDHGLDPGHHDDDDAPPAKVVALKWLFLAAAVMLIVSTLLGLWMALTQNRRRLVLLGLFILGAATPVVILTLL